MRFAFAFASAFAVCVCIEGYCWLLGVRVGVGGFFLSWLIDGHAWYGMTCMLAYIYYMDSYCGMDGMEICWGLSRLSLIELELVGVRGRGIGLEWIGLS